MKEKNLKHIAWEQICGRIMKEENDKMQNSGLWLPLS